MGVSFYSSYASVWNTGGSTTSSFGYDCGTGSDRLLLTQTRTLNNSVAAVSYNGTGFTYVTAYSGIAMWQLTAPTTGSNTFTFTTSSSYTLYFATIACFNGVDQTTPLGSATTASGYSTAPSTGSMTCTPGGAIYASEYSYYSSGAPNPTIAEGVLASTAKLSETIAGGYRTSAGTIRWTIQLTTWWVQGFPINPTPPSPNARFGDMNFMGI